MCAKLDSVMFRSGVDIHCKSTYFRNSLCRWITTTLQKSTESSKTTFAFFRLNKQYVFAAECLSYLHWHLTLCRFQLRSFLLNELKLRLHSLLKVRCLDVLRQPNVYLHQLLWCFNHEKWAAMHCRSLRASAAAKYNINVHVMSVWESTRSAHTKCLYLHHVCASLDFGLAEIVSLQGALWSCLQELHRLPEKGKCSALHQRIKDIQRIMKTSVNSCNKQDTQAHSR